MWRMLGIALLALQITWRPLQPGVDFATIDKLYVVRIDPKRAHITAGLASENDGARRTGRQWCDEKHLAVAINLGMFQGDGLSNVGYARHGTRLNNPRWNDYRSVLAVKAGEMRWLDFPADVKPLDGYELVVQNLRLIAGDGKNVWAPSARKWSEAAIATDASGHLLFLFSRVPYTMRDFNAYLLSLPLGITKAMHVEGGPEASLSIHAGGVNLDLCGSYETGFQENDANVQQWPIPNVLGVTAEP